MTVNETDVNCVFMCAGRAQYNSGDGHCAVGYAQSSKAKAPLIATFIQ
jgi:hypothetical protein